MSQYLYITTFLNTEQSFGRAVALIFSKKFFKNEDFLKNVGELSVKSKKGGELF